MEASAKDEWKLFLPSIEKRHRVGNGYLELLLLTN